MKSGQNSQAVSKAIDIFMIQPVFQLKRNVTKKNAVTFYILIKVETVNKLKNGMYFQITLIKPVCDDQSTV